MRRAFTLIELLVIIGIMGLMVTVGIVSVRSGSGAARTKGATRDIVAAIRQARSTALVTQRPAVITYAVESEDGEPTAKVEIHTDRLFTEEVDRSKIQTLTGGPLADGKREAVHIEEAGGDAIQGGETQGGETLEDALLAPIDPDILKGIRLKVLRGDELQTTTETVRRSRISVFSTTDYLIGQYEKQKKSATTETKGLGDSTSGTAEAEAEQQEPVSIVWETNGRVEPHEVLVYADGKKPDQGLRIRVDAFGATKVLNGNGEEEE